MHIQTDFFSLLLSLCHTHANTHTHPYKHTLMHLICDAVMQNILRLNTNAESMHMFDLL